MLFGLALLATASTVARADFVPTAPGPGDTFAAGSTCQIQWKADTTGHWKNVSIFLMTGPNNNMSRLQTVASGLDGTDQTLSPLNWTCPQVDPYSAIYFYQFTNGDEVQNSTWTTRFAITSPSGDSQPPEYKNQSNGDAIPWGQGRVVSEDGTWPRSGSTSANDTDTTAHKEIDGTDHRETAETSSVQSVESTRSHKHSKPTRSVSPTDTSQPSPDATTASNTESARKSHYTTDQHSVQTQGKGVFVPTASIFTSTKKPHAPHASTGSSTLASPRASCSSAACVRAGTGAPDGDNRLDNSGRMRWGSRHLGATSLYPLLAAMLL